MVCLAKKKKHLINQKNTKQAVFDYILPIHFMILYNPTGMSHLKVTKYKFGMAYNDLNIQIRFNKKSPSHGSQLETRKDRQTDSASLRM
jgi:hypothetical protein